MAETHSTNGVLFEKEVIGLLYDVNTSILSVRVGIGRNLWNDKWCRCRKSHRFSRIVGGPIMSRFHCGDTSLLNLETKGIQETCYQERVSALHSLAKSDIICTIPLFVFRTFCTVVPNVCLLKRVFVSVYSTWQEPPLFASPQSRPRAER